MGLFQGLPQGLDFLTMQLLDPGDLAGQREDEGVVRSDRGNCLGWGWPTLDPQASDVSAQAGWP
ncbi:hypothetical protein Slala05_64050 [Streptomyces lavendulae subsp. lavendulae]|nr:hypothetical protein Slala05_64050 [Streptomyces lavendulae subsp. lavendulae]